MGSDNERDVTLTIDYGDTLDSVLGYIRGGNPRSELILKLLEQGYSFRLVPTIQNGELLGVSLISVTARKERGDFE